MQSYEFHHTNINWKSRLDVCSKRRWCLKMEFPRFFGDQTWSIGFSLCFLGRGKYHSKIFFSLLTHFHRVAEFRLKRPYHVLLFSIHHTSYMYLFFFFWMPNWSHNWMFVGIWTLRGIFFAEIRIEFYIPCTFWKLLGRVLSTSCSYLIYNNVTQMRTYCRSRRFVFELQGALPRRSIAFGLLNSEHKAPLKRSALICNKLMKFFLHTVCLVIFRSVKLNSVLYCLALKLTMGFFSDLWCLTGVLFTLERMNIVLFDQFDEP